MVGSPFQKPSQLEQVVGGGAIDLGAILRDGNASLNDNARREAGTARPGWILRTRSITGPTFRPARDRPLQAGLLEWRAPNATGRGLWRERKRSYLLGTR